MLAYLMIYCMMRNNVLVHVKKQKENFIIEKCNIRGICFEQKLYVSMDELLPFDLSINSASSEVMLSSASDETWWRANVGDANLEHRFSWPPTPITFKNSSTNK